MILKAKILSLTGGFFVGRVGLGGADLQGAVHGQERDVAGEERPGRGVRRHQQEDRVRAGHRQVPGLRDVGPGTRDKQFLKGVYLM